MTDSNDSTRCGECGKTADDLEHYVWEEMAGPNAHPFVPGEPERTARIAAEDQFLEDAYVWLGGTRSPEPEAAPSGEACIYVASRSRHGELWRRHRDNGINIIASWIDEAGEGQTTDRADLMLRCTTEPAQADLCVVYAEPDDGPLVGALMEAGAALAANVPTVFVGPTEAFRFIPDHPASLGFVPTIPDAFNVARVIRPASPDAGERVAEPTLEQVRAIVDAATKAERFLDIDRTDPVPQPTITRALDELHAAIAAAPSSPVASVGEAVEHAKQAVLDAGGETITMPASTYRIVCESVGHQAKVNTAQAATITQWEEHGRLAQVELDEAAEKEEKLEDAITALTEALRAVEFSSVIEGTTYESQGYDSKATFYCPTCGEEKPDHYKTCGLADALKGADDA